MPQSDRSFAHITVEPDADEVVIQAGIGPEAAAPAPEAAAAPAAAVAEEAPAGGSPAAPAAADAVRRDGAPGARPQEAPAAEKAKGRRKDEYRQTTAEDLQGAPMPPIQKAVIVAAVVFIIGFIVYYCFLR